MAPLVTAAIIFQTLKALVYLALIIVGYKTIRNLPKSYGRFRAALAIVEGKEKAPAPAENQVVQQTEAEEVTSFFSEEPNLLAPAFLRMKRSIVELGYIFEDGELVKHPEMPIKQQEKQLRDSKLQEAVEIPAGAFGAIAC